MELTLILSILTIMLLIVLLVGVFIYFRFFYKSAPPEYIANPDYKIYQEMVTDE